MATRESISKSAQTAFLLMLLSVLSRFFGLFRDTYIASTFGASSDTDAFFLSNTFILLLSSFTTQAINTTMIPVLLGIPKKEVQKKNRFSNNLLNSLIIWSAALVLLGVIFTDPLSHVIAPGFAPAQRELLVNLTRIGLPCLIFYSIAGVFRGYLQSDGYFIESAFSEVIQNLVYILALLFIGQQYGVYVLTFSVIIASILQLAVQRINLYKTSYRYSLIIDFKDERMREVLILVIPVLISTGISDINILVSQALASTLEDGSLSALSYASKIHTLFITIFITSIATVFFPKISKAASETDFQKFGELAHKALVSVLAIAMPAMVSLLVLGELFVQIIYQRGSFDSNAAVLTAESLFYYSLALPGLSIRLICIKAFYAMKDTKTPVYNAIISFIINIILSLLLKPLFAHRGIALATAISSTVLALMLLANLKKAVKDIRIAKIAKSVVKISMASMMAGGAVYIIYNLYAKEASGSTVTQILILMSLGSIGMIIYVLSLLVLKMDEAQAVITKIRRRISGRF